MQCVNCGNSITPGLEISLPGDSATLCHCPYCLHAQPQDCSARAEQDGGAANVSVDRFEQRRRARERFVDGLLQDPAGRGLRCPLCRARLNKNDELALRNAERFCCPHCHEDLAEQAYRAVAYDETRWLPVIAALGRAHEAPGCGDCSTCAYLGAVATACRRALELMSTSHPAESEILAKVLDRSDWRLPDCDWTESCAAAREYRQLAAGGIALL